jgi:glycosyltransferase involved in cell wall biosynthesis
MGAVPRPLNVLFIAPYGGMGGSENVLVNMLERLDGRFAATVLVMENGPLAARIASLGVPVDVIHLPGRRSLWRFPAVQRRLIRRLRGRHDLIHANGGKAAVLAVPVARALGLPLVWMKHDHNYDGFPSKLLAARCDHVICVSYAMAAQFTRRRSHVSVIYPGVPLRDVGPVEATGPTIVSIGRLDPFKGFDEVLRAAAALRDGGLPVDVRIAGPPDRIHDGHEARLKALAEELGFGAAKVGWADDLDDVFAAARVVVLASKPRGGGAPGEGAPLVLMEGMGAGRPVVGTDQPGIAEVVGDAGTLVAPPTAARLAAALRPYLDDPQLAARAGERGRSRVRERMTLERTVSDLSALYVRLAAADDSNQELP